MNSFFHKVTILAKLTIKKKCKSASRYPSRLYLILMNLSKMKNIFFATLESFYFAFIFEFNHSLNHNFSIKQELQCSLR